MDSLANCTELKVFSLEGNCLAGQVPNSVGNLSSQLQYLYMGGNQLSGDLPSGIANLRNLISLQLTGNNFTCASRMAWDSQQSAKCMFIRQFLYRAHSIIRFKSISIGRPLSRLEPIKWVYTAGPRKAPNAWDIQHFFQQSSWQYT